MAESDLSQPVRTWLEAQGYTCYFELFDCDIVGRNGHELVAVELKPCLTRGLTSQLHQRARWADKVWGAIASKPKSTKFLQYYGYGLLIVKDGVAKQRVMARQQPWHRVKTRRYRFKRLLTELPAQCGDLAGLPSGPSVRTQRIHKRKPQGVK